EAQARGHRVLRCRLEELVAAGGEVHAWASQVTLTRTQGEHYTAAPAERVSLSALDCVFVRTDPPFDEAYLYATHLLSLRRGPKPLIVNEPSGLREAQEHLYALRFPDLTPDALVTSRRDELLAFLDAWEGRAVLKPIEGHGGEGVLLLRRGDANLSTLLELA